MTVHRAQRGYRLESRPFTPASSICESVEERWCHHCNTWISVRGVTGGLRFMAEHDSSDCSPEKEGGT